jgi:cell division septation protein DedD
MLNCNLRIAEQAMANMGRGTYEPPGNDVHIFDASEDDDDVEGSRLPLLIVIALFVLAAFAGVVWLAYTQGVQRGRSDMPRVIAAEKGPAKVAASGQDASTPFKGLKIYQQPAPADADAEGSSTDQAQQGEAPAIAPETTLIKPPSDAATNPEGAPAQHVQAAAPNAAPPPALKPSLQSSAEAAAPPAQVATKPAAPIAEKPAPAPATGSYVLQIGSYKSQAEAEAAWRTYQGKHSGTLSGYAQDIKMVDLGAKGTWYRLRVGSFADKAAAQALCAKLTAEGGACFPSK